MNAPPRQRKGPASTGIERDRVSKGLRAWERVKGSGRDFATGASGPHQIFAAERHPG